MQQLEIFEPVTAIEIILINVHDGIVSDMHPRCSSQATLLLLQQS